MQEKTLQHNSPENISNKEILELVDFQRNDLVSLPELNIAPKDGVYSEGQSRRLADWARNGDLKSALDAAGYEESECSEASNTLLRLSLMTPQFIYDQNHRDGGKRYAATRDLTDYNEALRETIEANPSMNVLDLTTSLQSTVLWAGLPDSYRISSGRIIERTIAGARGELIMKQLTTSQIAKAEGINYVPTSSAEDTEGVDLRLTVPTIIKNEVVRVQMPIDVKSDVNQVLALFHPDEELKPYKIRNGIVVLWPNISHDELTSNLLLDAETTEQKAKGMIPVLQEAANEYDSYCRRNRLQMMSHVAIARSA